MTSKRRLKDNSIKALLIVVLFLFLSFNSCVVNGQIRPADSREFGYVTDRYVLTDSTWDNREETDRPLYVGFEVSLGHSSYTLQSDIPQLSNLMVSYFGGAAGGVLANQLGKLKANIGLYYSDASAPYTFDLLTGNVSANLYLLRIRQVKYHTLEPYLVGGVSAQQTKFYGTYLNDGMRQNYSTAEEQLLGKVATTQFNVGLGAEYQLKNDQGNFIFLFAEVVCGVPVATRHTREAFDRTHIINPVSISVGVGFGKIKQYSK
jgi:hypothetical protein